MLAIGAMVARSAIGMHQVALACALAVLVCGGGEALAGPRRIAETAVPRAAVAAVAERFPRARRIEWSTETEGGVTTFEAALRDGERRRTVEVTQNGLVLRETERLARRELPSTIKRSLDAALPYRGLPILRASRVIWRQRSDATEYELVVRRRDGRPVRLVFSTGGELIGVEVGLEEDD